MRMWGTHPGLLCNKHLLGEHVEMHMLAGCILRGKSLAGYMAKGFIDIRLISSRHNILAYEMENRGMRHMSACPKLFEFSPHGETGYIDIERNLIELQRRCTACRKKILIQ